MQFSFSSIALGLFALHAVALPTEDAPVVSLDARKQKTPVDAATYQDLVHYASFPSAAGDLADGTCTNPPYGSTIVKYFDMKFSDTQAALFRDDNAKELVLGIPGTADTQDLITDFVFVPLPYLADNIGLKCAACLIHAGFLGAWDSISQDVAATIAAQLQQHPDYSVVISGHSLGGAIAQLAFGSLKPVDAYKVKAAYTYGQPRVGNLFFAEYINKLAGASDENAGIFHRTTHFNDGVPQLPPLLLGFVHSQTEYWESTNATSQATTFRCYGNEPAECNDSIGGGFINAAHSSYAGLRYSCS